MPDAVESEWTNVRVNRMSLNNWQWVIDCQLMSALSSAPLLVIVPAHNEEASIATTIHSILSQTVRPTSVIVVSDNSTDATVEIAKQFPVSVMETEGNTHRKAGAMNQAWVKYARDADYEYVMTMDADTALAPDFIEGALREIEREGNEDVGGVCARYWAGPGKGLVWRIQRLEYARFDDLRELAKWRVSVLSGAAVVYKASALAKVISELMKSTPWDNDSLIEDYALTLDLKTVGYRVRAASGGHALTDIPKTFKELWIQRQRWGRGGVDEVRKRGWIPATRRDILSYGLFMFCIAVRLLTVTMITASLALGLGYGVSLIIFIPMGIMAIERITSVWRLADKSWKDILFAAMLIPEDLYGFFMEICTIRAIYCSYRRTNGTW